MSDTKLIMRVLKHKLSVFQLPVGSPMPMWVFDGEFFTISKTADELSVICEDDFIPDNIKKESLFKAIKIEGILDFSMIGIIAGISSVLANEGISIFTLSTYNTDYFLIREQHLDAAIKALNHAGYDIKR